MASKISILTFHAIDNYRSPISFAPKLFRECLEQIHERGYRTISLNELRSCLDSGKGFPNKALIITFDDGYQSVFQEAYPHLHDRGMQATLFLATGKLPGAAPEDRFASLGGRSMMNWREVIELHQAGWEIGAHTLTHPDLRQIPLAQAIQEIMESRRQIEEQLGSKVDVFAYPYGRKTRQLRNWLPHNFSCACGTHLSLVSCRSDAYELERVDMHYLRARRLFPLLFSPWLASYLRARRLPREMRQLTGRRDTA
jgi:peptidoglycan/xylan/chitin deacetylase (PgdA/CDA1 family)